MIPEKMLEVLKKDGGVAIATLFLFCVYSVSFKKPAHHYFSFGYQSLRRFFVRICHTKQREAHDFMLMKRMIRIMNEDIMFVMHLLNLIEKWKSSTT